MLKWIETTGRSEEDAISAALFQLGLDRDDVSVEVIERAKSGFLGFGSNPAKVRVSYQEVDGKPRPVTDEPLLEEAPAPVLPAAKPAPEREETVLAAAKPAQKAAPAPRPAVKEEVPAAPVAEETILAAKPGMAPPKQRQSRPERRERPRPRREERLQEGDEVLIGSAPAPQAPVTMDPAAPDDEKAGQIRTFLTGLMEHLKVQAAPEIFVTSEGNYKVVLQGRDLGAIIGRRGETLDAIQQAGGIPPAAGHQGGGQGDQIPEEHDPGAYERLRAPCDPHRSPGLQGRHYLLHRRGAQPPHCGGLRPPSEIRKRRKGRPFRFFAGTASGRPRSEEMPCRKEKEC